MFEAIVQVWFLAVLLLALMLWRARDDRARARAGRWLARLTGLVGAAAVWEALGGLPFGGWPARISLAVAVAWGVVWYVRVRLLPAWAIWWRQFLEPHAMITQEDPRDVHRLHWPRMAVNYEEAVAPYLPRGASR